MKKMMFATMLLMLLLAEGVNAQGPTQPAPTVLVNFAVNMQAEKDVRVYITETLPGLLDESNDVYGIISSMPDLDTLEKKDIQGYLTIAAFNKEILILYEPDKDLHFEYAVHTKNLLASKGYDVVMKKVSEISEGRIINFFIPDDVVCPSLPICEYGAKFSGYDNRGCPTYVCKNLISDGHAVSLKEIGDKETIYLEESKVTFELVNIHTYTTNEDTDFPEETLRFADLEVVTEHSNVASSGEVRIYDGRVKKLNSYSFEDVVVEPSYVRFMFYENDGNEPGLICPEYDVVCEPGTYPQVTGYDENGCKVVDCVKASTSCGAPDCEGAYHTGDYYDNGCPVYECGTDFCQGPPSDNCRIVGKYSIDGRECPTYLCPGDEDTEKPIPSEGYTMEVGENLKFNAGNTRVSMVLTDIKTDYLGTTDEERTGKETLKYAEFDITIYGNSGTATSQKVRIYEGSQRTFSSFVIDNLRIAEADGTVGFTVTNRNILMIDTAELNSYGSNTGNVGETKKILPEDLTFDETASGRVDQGTSCDGCVVDGRCVDVGVRFKNGEASYCDISGDIMIQKQEGASCQNNYECESNTCASGECVDLVAQVRENTGLLQKILGWISGIF